MYSMYWKYPARCPVVSPSEPTVLNAVLQVLPTAVIGFEAKRMVSDAIPLA